MSWPQTPVSTEQVFATLFSLGCAIGGTTLAPSPTPFNTMSRVFRQWSQFPVSAMPAFYQQETTQTATGWDRGVGIRKLRAWWWVYLPTSSNPQDISALRM